MSAEVVAITPEPSAVYRMYDAAGTLLYVGATSRLPMRVSEHGNQKPWFTSVDRIMVEHFPDRASALAAEADAQKRERPLHDSQYGPGVPSRKENRAANKERREAEAAAKAADQQARGVYETWFSCSNCAFRDRVEVAKGKRTSEVPCPYCGCKRAMTVTGAAA